ncbi:MAG: hypothetical protein JNJ71_06035 [Rubrivivax sp.]|nr:hypothetical protein [Rubrivivax sp.]
METQQPAQFDKPPRRGLFRDAWAFLNRDVRSFGWWGRDKRLRDHYPTSQSADDSPDAKPAQPLEAVASEVDPQQIARLRFRREVLDWRDEFHFNVTESACQAHNCLTERVDRELADIGIWRRLLTKPSNEVLETHIWVCVRSPMTRALQQEVAALRQRLKTWFPENDVSADISLMWPKLEWDTRLSLKFHSDNRLRILAVLRELTLGNNGIADRHRRWATEYASKILDAGYAESDSI